MGFYIRKSLSVGPLRLNLSKSGIGVSAGIPGFRVGSGPGGNYVHAGRGGFYYRKSLSNNNPRVSQKPKHSDTSVRSSDLGVGKVVEVESSHISQLVDASSKDLINEINRKLRLTPYWPFALLGSGVLLVFAVNVGIPVLATGAVATLLLAATIYLAFTDALRKTTVLFYTFDQDAELRFQTLHDAFGSITKCSASWNIQTRADVRDLKRNAGATELIQRLQIRPSIGTPRWIKTNIPIPVLPAGKQTLYFFPDRVFVLEANTVGAVGYSELRTAVNQLRFIEDSKIPSDARVIDKTWKFVNKSGGPDRRFSNNRELPVVEYESVHFQSASGLNELFHFSKTGVGEQLQRSLLNLRG